MPIVGSTPWHKGLRVCGDQPDSAEASALPPAVNFGRMPVGYRMSSGNNARLVSTGKRFRGGPGEEQDASHLPGIPLVGLLEGDPGNRDWCGHAWSEWMVAREALRIIPPEANGLYRLRVPGQAELLYIGQGLVRARLLAHMLKVGQPTHRQSALFAGPLECSWVLGSSWFGHQRLELENDLIAAYVLSTGTIPQAQCIG